MQFTLFDALVQPILSLCCEVWPWVILGGKTIVVDYSTAMQKLELGLYTFLAANSWCPYNDLHKLCVC